jgi:SAM-dependent methyltransferase
MQMPTPLPLDCPVCGTRQLAEFLKLPRAPAFCNVQAPTRAAALDAAAGEIVLGYCAECTHIANMAFDPGQLLYSDTYENSLYFSSRFRAYIRQVCQHLIDRYGLRGRTIVDIGCGKGDLLRTICAMGGNRGIGFDRSRVPDPGEDQKLADVRFVQDFYSEEFTALYPDLVVCFHVLEHLEKPAELLATILRTAPRAALFLAVPNGEFMIREFSIWDVLYEHFSYFTRLSLEVLLAREGCEIRSLEASFDAQYLTAEAVPARAAVPGEHTLCSSGINRREFDRAICSFQRDWNYYMDFWRERLAGLAATGRRAVVWGAGSKGVMFLNLLDCGNSIQYAVDVNPRKQGRFIPGTAQKIVAPEFLTELKPDIMILMNDTYLDEVGGIMRNLGISAEIWISKCAPESRAA